MRAVGEQTGGLQVGSNDFAGAGYGAAEREAQAVEHWISGQVDDVAGDGRVSGVHDELSDVVRDRVGLCGFGWSG